MEDIGGGQLERGAVLRGRAGHPLPLAWGPQSYSQEGPAKVARWGRPELEGGLQRAASAAAHQGGTLGRPWRQAESLPWEFRGREERTKQPKTPGPAAGFETAASPQSRLLPRGAVRRRESASPRQLLQAWNSTAEPRSCSSSGS